MAKSHCFSSYLLVRDRKGIPELTKLRSGTNRLRIEKGRYDKLPVEKRLCRFCEADAVEDEKHFLLHCEEYEGLRQKMWKGLEARPPSRCRCGLKKRS